MIAHTQVIVVIVVSGVMAVGDGMVTLQGSDDGN